MKMTLFFTSIFLWSLAAPLSYAEDTGGKVRVIYKKREKIDLEDISIKGDFVTPGDFSIEAENQKGSETIFRRKNYNDRLPMNIEYVY